MIFDPDERRIISGDVTAAPGSDSEKWAGPRLREVIVEEIRRNGPIPFSRYMELCLYHPELGYYSHAAEQFGKAGDFYTSSDVHAVFGRLLARQFAEMWRELDSPRRIDVIELGPGRGLFARDVLDWCEKHFPDFARAVQYRLVEQSAALRARLGERLSGHVESEKARIFDTLESASASASEALIVFANEFFDALPIEIVDHRGSVRVAADDGKLGEQFVPPSRRELEFLDHFGVQPEAGERVEVPLASQGWMVRLANVFDGRRGFAVIIDYGYTRDQQLAGRHRDTLMTYRRHQAGSSPYESPGEQDITAHVNFTALRNAAEEKGLEILALLTQSQFLIGIGEQSQFRDAFQECKLPQERAKVALQLKHLVHPEGMGEAFQTLLLSRDVSMEKAARLSGLRLWSKGKSG